MVRQVKIKKEDNTFDKKTFIVIATLIFVGGLFFGNLSNPQTGFGTYGRLSYFENDPFLADRGTNPVTIVKVTPRQIFAGETIQIHIDPGHRGARHEVKIYKVNDQGQGVLRDITKIAGFSGSTRIQGTGFLIFHNVTFDYKTGTTWQDGAYEVRVYDNAKGAFVGDVFEIAAYKSKGFDVRYGQYYEQLAQLER